MVQATIFSLWWLGTFVVLASYLNWNGQRLSLAGTWAQKRYKTVYFFQLRHLRVWIVYLDPGVFDSVLIWFEDPIGPRDPTTMIPWVGEKHHSRKMLLSVVLNFQGTDIFVVVNIPANTYLVADLLVILKDTDISWLWVPIPEEYLRIGRQAASLHRW